MRATCKSEPCSRFRNQLAGGVGCLVTRQSAVGNSRLAHRDVLSVSCNQAPNIALAHVVIREQGSLLQKACRPHGGLLQFTCKPLHG
jgi:hypothetical protein